MNLNCFLKQNDFDFSLHSPHLVCSCTTCKLFNLLSQLHHLLTLENYDNIVPDL